MIIEAAKTQDQEVGDGTTTVAILAGELLKKAEDLIGMGVHPTVIVDGYNMAAKKAFEIVDSLAIDVSEKDKDILNKIAITSMTGKWAASAQSKIPGYVVDLVLSAVETSNGKKTVDLDDLEVEKKVGEGAEDTEMVQGVIVDKEIVHQNMPRSVKNAKIALLTAPIEARDTETKAEIQITSSTQFQLFLDHERDAIKAVVDKVIASGANVVLTQKGIDDMAQHLLAKAGILALRRVKKADLDRISRATGANILTSLDELNSSELGEAGIVEERQVGNGVMTFVTETKNPGATTMILRGGTKQALDSLERAIDDAMHSVADAIEDGKLVAGGGSPEIELSLRLREYAATLKGREQLAVLKFAEAVEVVPKALAENAGFNPIDKLVELKKSHDTEKTAGLDVFTGKVVNMLDAGVVEPLRVKIQAIQSATDAAALILRIDDVLASTKKPPERPPSAGMGGMPPGMMGGMGGMGGMPGMM
jgi:thermosome